MIKLNYGQLIINLICFDKSHIKQNKYRDCIDSEYQRMVSDIKIILVVS